MKRPKAKRPKQPSVIYVLEYRLKNGDWVLAHRSPLYGKRAAEKMAKELTAHYTYALYRAREYRVVRQPAQARKGKGR